MPLRWEICTDPNCDHRSHGSLRRVVQIMLGIQERVRRENPEEWARMQEHARAREEAHVS